MDQESREIERKPLDSPEAIQRLLVNRLRRGKNKNPHVLAQMGLKEAQACFPQEEFQDIPSDRDTFSKWFADILQELPKDEREDLLIGILSNALELYKEEYDYMIRANDNSTNGAQATRLRNEKPRRVKTYQQAMSLLRALKKGKVKASDINKEAVIRATNKLVLADLKEEPKIDPRRHNSNGTILQNILSIFFDKDLSNSADLGIQIYRSTYAKTHNDLFANRHQEPLQPDHQERLFISAAERLRESIQKTWIPSLLIKQETPAPEGTIPSEWLNQPESPPKTTATKETTRKRIIGILKKAFKRS